jgi:hypothetical protein
MDSGVYLSSNSGVSWTRSSSGITVSDVYRIAVSPSGHLFAATLNGVFRSTNNGLYWTEFNSGLTNQLAFSLVVDASGFLHVGTLGGGTFRTVQPTTYADPASDKTPSSFVLNQNYPNPFNSSTKIRFVLPRAGYVTAKVYDIVGRELSTLASAIFPPGEHTVQWDATGYPSGVYFYRFQTGDIVQTKKLILLK